MSEVKVNKISPRTACGTVTLGDSGDTFTIPAGATINNQGTAVNFGATGSASWVTTVKTSTFTAVAGEGYFVNTTGGVVSVNLPAGTAGDVVAIKDYANTFDSNAVTLVQNGSDKIGGSAVNAVLSTEGLAVTLVFVDSTQGWLVTDNGTQDTAPTTRFITATGGTITCSGNFRIHTFTGPGALCVSCAGNPSGSTTVDYLVVASGGGGGSGLGGGGGAGGFRTNFPSSCSGIPVSVQPYPIAVGSGGAAGIPDGGSGTPGNNSTFSSITSTAGGGAVARSSPTPVGPGGSGGGGSGLAAYPGGTGNTPPTSPPQGNDGGDGSSGTKRSGGGGGGAAGDGGDALSATYAVGGVGSSNSITGSAIFYAGGGGGNGDPGGPAPSGLGGNGGGGNGGPSTNGTAGADNTGGGGGGGAGSCSNGAAGGSGIVIIRYKFQN
jgi:hypothetical protein